MSDANTLMNPTVTDLELEAAKEIAKPVSVFERLGDLIWGYSAESSKMDVTPFRGLL